jgi:hypothetical protein
MRKLKKLVHFIAAPIGKMMWRFTAQQHWFSINKNASRDQSRERN